MASNKNSDARQRQTVLGANCVTHAVQDGLSATTYVLLPILAQTLGLTYTQVGIFKGVKNVAQGLLELSSGVVSERFGERVLLVVGLAMAGIGYACLSFSSSAHAVLVSLLIVGIGGAYQHAPASALVSRAYIAGGRRGALGLYNSMGDAGKLVFTGCFGLAVATGMTWPTVTLAYGLSAVAVAVGVHLALGSVGAGLAYRPKTGGGLTAGSVATGWGILDRRGFSALLAAVFLDGMVQAGAMTFMAFVMVEKGLPLAIATFAAVALLVGGMCGKAVCGFLAERIGVRTAFTIAQVLTALGLLAVLVVPSGMAYVLLPIVGIALQGSTSITYGMVDDLVHADRTTRGFALVYAAASFASVAGPVGFGAIADAAGINTALIAMAVVAAATIVPGLLLRVPTKLDMATRSGTQT